MHNSDFYETRRSNRALGRQNAGGVGRSADQCRIFGYGVLFVAEAGGSKVLGFVEHWKVELLFSQAISYRVRQPIVEQLGSFVALYAPGL